MSAFAESSGAELDEWGSENNFQSIASKEREIQTLIDNNPRVDPASLIPEELSSLFYFDEFDWLQNRTPDQLMSEFLSLDRALIVEGNLHIIEEARHVTFEDAGLEALTRLDGDVEHAPSDGVYAHELKSNEIWHNDFGNGTSREEKYFSCPRNKDEQINIYGHRKEKHVSGTKHRMVVELVQAAYAFGGSSNLVVSYIGMALLHEDSSLTTYPLVS